MDVGKKNTFNWQLRCRMVCSVIPTELHKLNILPPLKNTNVMEMAL